MKRRHFTAAALLPFSGVLHAQADWPSRPVKLIVPYPAGGGTDAFARLVGERMRQELGQTVLVENKPGAGTMIGAESVATSPPDGYTVLLGDNGTYAVNRALYKKMPYDVERDFAPVTLTGRFALLLVVHPSLGVNTLAEFVALAKAKPGALNYASVGAGSPHHLAMEMFRQRTGIDLQHVAYKGGAPAVGDLLPGRVPIMFLDLVTAKQHLEAGKIKALGVASLAKLPQLPNVPSIAEALALPGFEAWAWQGFSVPAATPPAVIQKLNKAYAAAAADPDIRKRMGDLGTELTPSTPAEMAAHVKAEAEKWARIVKAGNITIE